MKAIVYETFQHLIPTGRGWQVGLTDLGVDCYALPSTEYSLSDLDEPVDVIAILCSIDTARCNDIISFRRNNPNTKICVVTLGYQPEYDRLAGIVDVWVEMVYSHSHSVQEFRKLGLKLIFVPLAANDHVFFPTHEKQVYDVSFMGTMGAPGEREEDKYLYPVIDKGYKGFFAGFSYKGMNANVRYLHKCMNEVYNRTKVNLNFHYPYQKEEVEGNPISRCDFNGRVYEIAMSGNFQICDHPAVADHFLGGVPYIPKDKWMEAIDYYLVHDSERIAMAGLAREVALEKHTWKKRMEEFLAQI